MPHFFYYQMDWEDKADFKKEFNREIEVDELRIRFYDGKVVYSALKVKEFEQIFYDYSKKLFEVYQSETSLPESWNDKMTKALEKLKSKI